MPSGNSSTGTRVLRATKSDRQKAVISSNQKQKAGCFGSCLCVPTTCAQRSLQCGPAGGGDGCGHALHCGACGHVAACNVSLLPLPLGNSTACFDNDAAASAPFTSVRDCPQLVALLQSAGLQDGCAVNLTLAGLHVGGDGE